MTVQSSRLSTSISLIRRARLMEPEAWSLLTRLYGPLIYSWARKSGLQSNDAADVLQAVFISVWRGLPAFTLDRPDASFRGWLRIITSNTIRAEMRRRRPVTASKEEIAALADSDLEEDSDFASDDLYSELTRHAIDLVRSTVDSRTWNAFWMMAMEEASASEVASLLGMTSLAVRQAKFRVICRLKSLLADQ
ncbi:sigma-70 family RNA polymerase sigma factor [bacterium]|nr:sigma-70 family RNA polymerase sigma factor [bacterium]